MAFLSQGLLTWALVAAACGLDRLLGDPRGWLHPVQVMGGAISRLRRHAEAWAGDRAGALRLAGLLITLVVVVASALAGWALERFALAAPAVGVPLLLIALASALAGRSLAKAVREVIEALPSAQDSPGMAPAQQPGDDAVSPLISPAGPITPGAASDLGRVRERLAWIVGRDVAHLDAPEILRALAETASENGVDGLFAPLFWMLAGAALWSLWPPAALAGAAPGALTPGPLCLAWLFKAASTLDSMLGYRRGRLRWLGTAGARLDDILTWLPCRLVALTLPLLAGGGAAASEPGATEGPWRRFRRALREGAPDPSPNAGVSQAAYALAAGVRLGGLNHYGGEVRAKPLLAAHCPAADREAVERILELSDRLEGAWLLAALPLLLALAGLPLGA